MQISRLRIDRFGLWNDLDLKLNAGGVSVIAGPNEAGKTTLLRFLRGVLYGFPAGEAGVGGGVDLLRDGRRCRVDRYRESGSRETVNVEGLPRVGPAEDLLNDLVAGTSRSVFENVFALGLVELQQLAALHIEETAARLYGVSLGSDGKRLLQALQTSDAARRAWIDGEQRTGRLVGFLARDEHHMLEANSAAERRDQYDRLLVSKSEAGERIHELNDRRAGMESQLAGHRYMQRIWEPWNQVREYEQQLRELPETGELPDNGLKRLREIDAEMQSEYRCRQSVLREIDQLRLLRKEARPDAETRKAIASLKRMLSKRDRIEREADDLEASRSSESQLRAKRDAKLAELGPGWSAERLADVDTSPAAQQELLHAARTYQNAIVRRGRFRRTFQKAIETHKKCQAKLNTHRERLNGQSIDAAIAAESAKLNNLGHAGEWELKEVELKQKRDGLRALIDDVRDMSLVPAWFLWVLWFFAAAGGLVAILGLVSSATTNLLAGLILCLSGLTGLGMAWGLKHHTDSSSRSDVGKRKSRLFEVEHELAETRRKLGGQDAGDDGSAANAVAERLAELQQLQRRQQRLERLNKRCIQLRNRKTTVLQEFGHARQQWTETLNAVGLPETLKIDEAFENQQRALEADQAQTAWQNAADKRQRLQQRCDQRRERFQRLGRTLRIEWPDDANVTSQLDACAIRLKELSDTHIDVSTLKEEYRKRRGEADEYRNRLRALKRERHELLRAAGARDADDLERLVELDTNRRELEELLELVREDLRVAAETEPELAIAEEDLHAYDADEHSECIKALEAELADIQSDLQRSHEELGGLNEAMTRLENDRGATRDRFRHLREEAALRDAANEWLAGELTAATLHRLRTRFERDKQPRVLQSASRFFAELTGGRYARLWAPLGQRRLCADDADGRTWELDQLSGGTREQIFLALRLALVEEYADRGVKLPLILDDVLVNFDRVRTEAAIETLLRMANDGQQIVFLTCHQHIEELFAKHGIDAVQLPAIHAEQPHRIAG